MQYSLTLQVNIDALLVYSQSRYMLIAFEGCIFDPSLTTMSSRMVTEGVQYLRLCREQ